MTSWQRAAVVPILACLLAGSAAAGAQVWRLDSPPACQERAPKVLALGGGAFAAVWQGSAEPGAAGRPRIFARFFERYGVPRGAEFQINGDYDAVLLDAAVNADGHILVIWQDLSRRELRSRAYHGPTGQPLEDERLIFGVATPSVALAATGDGGFAMVLAAFLSADVLRFDSTGRLLPGIPHPLEGSLSLNPNPPEFLNPAIAPYGHSGVVAVWVQEEEREGVRTLLGRVLTSNGVVRPLAVSARGMPILPGEVRRPRPAVEVTDDGRILVAWNEQTDDGEALRAQVFGQDLFPLSTFPFDLEAPSAGRVSAPAAAAGNDDGGFLVAWHSLPSLPPVDGVPPIAHGRVSRVGTDGRLAGPVLHAWDTDTDQPPSLAVDRQGHDATAAWPTGGPAAESCSSQGIFARHLDFSSDALKLHHGRFQARIRWTDHAGNTGEGRAVPLSDDSGYFWFFGPGNVEVVVKVLDGRGINGRFWVFYGALSDVEYTVLVRDTGTGQVRTYHNPAGQLASRADTEAF